MKEKENENEKDQNIKSSLIYESKNDNKAEDENIEELEDFLDDLLWVNQKLLPIVPISLYL